jgi:5-methylcytosine-specific restriction endonuclease McrA
MSNQYTVSSYDNLGESRKKIEASGQFKYIKGFVNVDKPVIVQCLKCGTFQTKPMSAFRVSRRCKATCNVCNEISKAERTQRENYKRLILERDKQIQKLLVYESKNTGEQLGFRQCKVCGELFFEGINTKRIYCSDKCSKRVYSARKESLRRIRLKQQMVDKDISLEKLYRRDKGICYLCGKECNWDDHKINNDNFIAGPNYPSIDHVKPLSKGGKHSWDNVRLAHFVCNTNKGARLIPSHQEKCHDF